MSVYAFNSLPKGKNSNLFIIAAFSRKYFSVKKKTSLAVRNSYLLTFPDDKAEILAACPSKSYWALFCLIVLFLLSLYNKFFLNLNGISDSRVVSFTKNEYGSLVYSLKVS